MTSSGSICLHWLLRWEQKVVVFVAWELVSFRMTAVNSLSCCTCHGESLLMKHTPIGDTAKYESECLLVVCGWQTRVQRAEETSWSMVRGESVWRMDHRAHSAHTSVGLSWFLVQLFVQSWWSSSGPVMALGVHSSRGKQQTLARLDENCYWRLFIFMLSVCEIWSAV